VALPHRRQRNFARFIPYHELTRHQVATRLGISKIRLNNIINGDTYPTPEELDNIEQLFGGMPAQVLFDPEMLEYRHDWPPPSGFKQKRAALEAEIDRLRKKAGE
jgi:transcriptional regulator with XRE-family HTH domain